MQDIYKELENRWSGAVSQIKKVFEDDWISNINDITKVVDTLLQSEKTVLGVCGPGASGKSTFLNHLCQSYGFKRLINTTTRAQREGEKENIEYRFISFDKYQKDVANGQYVVHEQKSGRGYYGIYWRDFNKIIQENKICIIESPLVLSRLFSVMNDQIHQNYQFFLLYFIPNEPIIKNLKTYLLNRDSNLTEEKVMVEHGWRQIEEFCSLISIKNNKLIASYVIQGIVIEKIFGGRV